MHKSLYTRLLLLGILFIVTSCNKQIPELVTPRNYVTISDNIPVLGWIPIDCDYQEIWINGIKMDSLQSDISSYVPFPLAFGKTEWMVVAIKGKKRIQSVKAVFTVDDLPLSQLPDKSQLLRLNWRIQSSRLTEASGYELSTEQNIPKIGKPHQFRLPHFLRWCEMGFIQIHTSAKTT
jgi:hypothetical protein